MKKLDDETGGKYEFCFIFSQAIIEDRNSMVRACAILASGLKSNLVAARSDADATTFPLNGECWRGGGFNMEHKDWFDSMVGKKYRIPAFLATSINRAVINNFMHMAQEKGFPVVQWKILMDTRGDPNGDNDARYKCKHVNLLRVTHVPGEEEFLFQAFSVFTVQEVVWSKSDPATMDDPHRITLVAAVDNAQEQEDLPLAKWR